MAVTKRELEKLVDRANELVPHDFVKFSTYHDATTWGVNENTAHGGTVTRFRGTARETAIWLIGFVQGMGEHGVPKKAAKNPAGAKTPELSGGANAFMEAVRQRLQLDGRRVHLSNRILGSTSSVYITLTNLPEGVGGAGGGAEAENNRFSVMVRGFDGKDPDAPPPSGKVTAETSVSVFPKQFTLRKKTAEPGRIAEYVADGINRIVREVPPRFTHTRVDQNPVWTQKYIDELPDTAFLIVQHDKATHKDKQGRSHPLSVRHLPYRDKSGKVNKAHVKNAISRANQVKGVPAATKARAKARAEKLYQRMK